MDHSSGPINLTIIDELMNDGYIVVVKRTGNGTFYNITPEGEKLRSEYESILKEDAPETVLSTKDSIRELIEKNIAYAKKTSKAIEVKLMQKKEKV